MRVWNKTIGSNSGGENQVRTQGSMIGQERLIFRQISTSGGTEITPSTANMQKGLTYRYILPWTTPERPKNHHWVSGWLAGQKWQYITAVFESLGENMTRPTGYKSESVNLRPRCVRMKPLGEIVDPHTRIWLFNYVSTRVLGDSSFCMNRNTLGAWEMLLKATRGVGKLSLLLLLRSPSSSMEILPLLGWWGWWATKLEAEMRMKGPIGTRSSCQEPWKRYCLYFMVIISSLFFNFAKPNFFTMERNFYFVEIRCKTLNSCVKLCC